MLFSEKKKKIFKLKKNNKMTDKENQFFYK